MRTSIIARFSLPVLVLATFVVVNGVTTSRRATATIDPTPLLQATHYYLTGQQAAPTVQEIRAANIVGNYALVDWLIGENVGGEVVLSKTSGTWMPVFGTGGDMTATEITNHTGISSATTTSLESGMSPVTPTLATPTPNPAPTFVTPPAYKTQTFTKSLCDVLPETDMFFPGDTDDFGKVVPPGYRYVDKIQQKVSGCGDVVKAAPTKGNTQR